MWAARLARGSGAGALLTVMLEILYIYYMNSITHKKRLSIAEEKFFSEEARGERIQRGDPWHFGDFSRKKIQNAMVLPNLQGENPVL